MAIKAADAAAAIAVRKEIDCKFTKKAIVRTICKVVALPKDVLSSETGKNANTSIQRLDEVEEKHVNIFLN